MSMGRTAAIPRRKRFAETSSYRESAGMSFTEDITTRSTDKA